MSSCLEGLSTEEIIRGLHHSLSGSLQVITSQLDLLAMSEDPVTQRRAVRALAALAEVRKNTKALTAAHLLEHAATMQRSFIVAPVVDEALMLAEGHPALAAHRLRRKSMDTSLVASGDPDYLGTALLNIVINAGEAMPEPGVVEVLTETDPVTHDIRIEVLDTGGGLPLESSDRVFDLYYSTKSNGSSRGIGLYLARALVEALGGTISAADRGSGEPGAVFSISLPPAGTPPWR